MQQGKKKKFSKTGKRNKKIQLLEVLEGSRRRVGQWYLRLDLFVLLVVIRNVT